MLSGKLLPNLGRYVNPPLIDEVLNHFKGSELQQFYTYATVDEAVNAVYKIQYVDEISKKFKGTIRSYLNDDCERSVYYRELFCLSNILDRTLEDLSGGELQRFSCALACSKKSNIYLFDEPSSYLDIKQRIIMANAIKQLSNDDSYVFVVEHDLSIMDYIADYVCIFYGTETVFGVVSEPMNQGDGINIYLDGYLPSENMRFRDYSLSFNINSVSIDDVKSQISYEYDELLYKVGNFSLNIEKGVFRTSEITVLLGENGMGKTLMMRLLAGLIPDNKIMNERIIISYKPQKLSPKFTGTVKHLLLSKITLNEQFVSDVIKPLMIHKLYDVNVSDLSGGQIQKVAIALALGKPADVYLLDEPSSYLDSEQRIIVSKIIKKFIINNHKVAFIVEHDFMMATYLADKVILFTGTPALESNASKQMSVEEGMNKFLKQMNVTLRTDTVSHRPRINKKNSVMEKEQIEKNQYFIY